MDIEDGEKKMLNMLMQKKGVKSEQNVLMFVIRKGMRKMFAINNHEKRSQGKSM